MKMKLVSILFFSLFIIHTNLHAQKIEVIIPQEANMHYDFILNSGTKKDTIQQGNLSFAGSAVINIPEKYKDYVGMGLLDLGGPKKISLVINHENFAVELKPNGEIYYRNSPENDFLSKAFEGNAGKTNNNLYATSFLDMYGYLDKLNNAISEKGTDLDKKDAKLYALKELNMDDLYTSGLWTNTISGWIGLYENDEKSFGNDMIQILKKIKSDKVFEGFSRNLVTITDQYGWDDAFDMIVPYIQQTGRVKTPTENLYKAFAMAKITKGSTAPAIEGLAIPLQGTKQDKTLLLFYEPGCENCKIQLNELINEYPKLEKSNIRVISISAGHDKESFLEDIKKFPWRDKLCDYKGFAGNNFMTYGIMGTPTYFLLDKNMKVIKRYANILDIFKSEGIR